MYENLPKVRFTKKIIDKVGDLGDVLTHFLESQKTILQEEFEKKFPKADNEQLKNILNEFASIEGTKIPLSEKELLEAGFDKAHIRFCLDRFEKSRILREDEGIYEIAHDSLALQIAESRSAEERTILEMENLVKSRYNAAIKTFLSGEELDSIAGHESKMRLSDKERAFLAESQEAYRKLNSEKYIRAIVWLVLGGLAILLTVVYIKNKQQGLKLRTTLLPYHSLEALEQEKNPTKAFNLAAHAHDYDSRNLSKRDDQAVLDAWYNEDNAPLHISFYGHTDAINSVQFGGSWFLTASEDGTAKLWSILTPEIKQDKKYFTTEYVHEGPVNYATFYGDLNNFILTCSDDSTAIVWDRFGNKLKTEKHQAPVRYGIFLPTKDEVLTLSGDNTWTIFRFTIHSGAVEDKLYKSTFESLNEANSKIEKGASAYKNYKNIIMTQDGDMMIMNRNAGFVPRYKSRNFGFNQFNDSWSSAEAFLSHDELTLFAIRYESIQIWNRESIKSETWEFQNSFISLNRPNVVIGLGNSGRIAVSHEIPEDEIHILNVNNDFNTETVLRDPAGISSFTASPNGNHIISGANDGSIKLWSLNLISNEYNESLGSDIKPLISKFTGDGKSAVMVMEDQVIFSNLFRKTQDTIVFADKYKAGKVTPYHLSQNGRYLLARVDTTDQLVWDLENDSIVNLILETDADAGIWYDNMAASPSGEWIILGHEIVPSIKQYSNSAGFHELKFDSEFPDIDYKYCFLSPNGEKLLASKENEGYVIDMTTFDQKNSKLEYQIISNENANFSFGYFPNERTLLVAFEDKMIHLYYFLDENGRKSKKINLEKPAKKYSGHNANLTSLRYSQSLHWLVAVDENNAINLWSYHDEEIIAQVTLPFKLADAAFAVGYEESEEEMPPLLGLTANGQIVELDLDVKSLKEKATSVGITQLTTEEKEFYQIEDGAVTRFNIWLLGSDKKK